MDYQERTGLRKLADEVTSLNLDGLDIGQLEQRLALIKSLREVVAPATTPRYNCGTFDCGTYKQRPGEQ